MRWFIVAVVALVLAGCGGGDDKGTPSGMTADQVVDALKAKGLPIGERRAFTATDDPNTRLGRPGEYGSKTNFLDTTVAHTGALDVIKGADGQVEAFGDEADAKKWADFTKAASASPLIGGYVYQQGRVVLRLARTFTSDQATAYEKALREAVK